jgi:chemotaxis protein methyltransferase CheR
MKEKNQQITDLLFRLQGIDLSKYDEMFLNKTMQAKIVEKNCKSEAEYYQLLNRSAEETDDFIDSLSISYSEFFRNPLTFSVLEKIILPSIIYKKDESGRKEIRIWSAACASGQETYSLVMLLKECSQAENINYRVFATDSSENQIEKAKLGNYHQFETGLLTQKRLQRWFDKYIDGYSVKNKLKRNIEFSCFDLLDKQYSCPPSSIFGDFDIIFCANVLFYYKPEFRKKILKKLRNSLSANGFLITGETEREILLKYGFREVYPQSAIFTV